MDKQPNVFSRLLSSLFQALNLTRKIILNLVFFSILLLFFIILTKDQELVTVPENSALVLNMVGDIVEQKHELKPFDKLVNEAVGRNEERPEVLLADVVNVINQAALDERIQLLVLNLANIGSAGLTKLRIIARAISDFKSSGKQVIALGDGFNQDQYYLASYADKIWLNPNGWLLLDGYGSYPLYFKSALDKLQISQHIFRVGSYKSAVEPYMRDSMSDEAKEANQLWLNELWTQYKTDVAEQRGFSITNFDETSATLVQKLTEANGNIAQYALSHQWVDELKSRPAMRAALINLVGDNKQKTSFNQIGFEDYLSAMTAKKTGPSMHKASDKVAVIVAKGVILDGERKPGTVGGDSLAKLLQKARDNDAVKAVVLRVDSPGGSAYASEVIRQEIELIKQAGKPVVASMSTYAASGGYWISAPADVIVAEPTTVTGSIGIYGMLMTVEKTLATLGIYTDGVGTTELAGFNITRPLTSDMAQLFQLSINRGYQEFLQLVAENRHMTLAEVDAVAQGRVWTGAKAQELGLVDELGNLADAIKLAASKANLTDYDTLLIEKELSAKDKLFQSLFAENATLASMLSPVTSALGAQLSRDNVVAVPFEQLLHQLKRQYTQLAQFNDPQGIYTFCETCNVR